MKTVTRKPIVKEEIEHCLTAYKDGGLSSCVAAVHQRILENKIKFPLLEYAGALLYEHLPKEEHINLCTTIEALKTIGGNVLIGIILQKRLSHHFEESLQMATHYISLADIWYVCDIIGERTYGYALLHHPQKTIPIIKDLSQHNSNWVIRSLGAGSHYAIKKGLPAKDTDKIFALLLTMANTKDKEIRQGVGWAAKTTAKFHPKIIFKYNTQINDKQKVENWFRKKIEIGLNRNNYAKRG